MKNIKKIEYVAYLFFTVIFVLGLSIAVQSLLADWSEPAQIPSATSNYFLPIDTSTSTQEKQGILIINDTVDSNTLIIANGDVGVGTSVPAARMEVVGGVKVGSDSICNAKKGGTLRYNSSGSYMEVCDGTNWRQMLTDGNAGASCSACVFDSSVYGDTSASGCCFQ